MYLPRFGGAFLFPITQTGTACAQPPSSFLRGFGIGKLNSIKTLGDPLVDGLTELFFRSETVRVLGGQRSTPPGTTIAAYMTSRPDLGERWPSRLVATAEEGRLSFRRNSQTSFATAPRFPLKNNMRRRYRPRKINVPITFC
jgi:hypothetical protein